jgi:hypothetical protein
VAKHPKIWTRVHSLSRRPPQEPLPDHFQSHAVDLLNNGPEVIAKQLREAGLKDIDYIFFYVCSGPLFPCSSRSRQVFMPASPQPRRFCR